MGEYRNALEIKNLTVKYDGFTLDDVSFHVPKGSIMGFIGQNGAGKTTTIRAIFNIVRRNAGTIRLLGMDNIEDELEVKEQISAVFDELPFHEQLNARQIGIILKGVYREWDSARYNELVERFGLPRKRRIGQFSKGMKMKLQIAAALSHNAKLLVMDEATTGLDPVVRNEILDIFQEYVEDKDHSILMSSHITSDLEKVADYVTFIHKGRILATGKKEEILSSGATLEEILLQYASAEKKECS